MQGDTLGGVPLARSALQQALGRISGRWQATHAGTDQKRGYSPAEYARSWPRLVSSGDAQLRQDDNHTSLID